MQSCGEPTVQIRTALLKIVDSGRVTNEAYDEEVAEFDIALLFWKFASQDVMINVNRVLRLMGEQARPTFYMKRKLNQQRKK